MISICWYLFILASNRNSNFWNLNAYANNCTGLWWSQDEVFNVLKVTLSFSHRCLNSVRVANSPESPPNKHSVCINYAFSVFVEVCFLVYLELTLSKNIQNQTRVITLHCNFTEAVAAASAYCIIQESSYFWCEEALPPPLFGVVLWKQASKWKQDREKCPFTMRSLSVTGELQTMVNWNFTF